VDVEVEVLGVSVAASRAAFLMASRAKWVRYEWVIKTVRLFACPVMKDCK